MLKGMLLARELRALGHDVEVLTGFPNYPGGVLYPGYPLRPIRTDVIDGIRVTRRRYTLATASRPLGASSTMSVSVPQRHSWDPSSERGLTSPTCTIRR